MKSYFRGYFMVKIHKSLFILCLLSFFVLPFIYLRNDITYTNSYSHQLETKHFIPTYDSHSPIDIDSDSDFTGFSGDGSENNPYIIENYEIVTTGVGIYIRGTTKHFIIKDCFIETNSDGIVIENVGSNTATIQDNVLNGTLGKGIEIESSSYVLVKNNTILGYEVGITIEDSHYAIIEDNNLTFSNLASSERAMVFSNSKYLRIIGNSITKYEFGMITKYSDFIVMANNTIQDCYASAIFSGAGIT